MRRMRNLSTARGGCADRLLAATPLWLGVMLAILALANIVGLSAWHGAMVGHDDARVAAAAFHNEGEPSLPEIDMHKVSHAMAQGLADIAPQLPFPAEPASSAARWVLAPNPNWQGTGPEGILRPPRM